MKRLLIFLLLVSSLLVSCSANNIPYNNCEYYSWEEDSAWERDEGYFYFKEVIICDDNKSFISIDRLEKQGVKK